MNKLSTIKLLGCILLLVLFASCSSVKKSQSRYAKNEDSVTVKKSTKAEEEKKDSTTVIKKSDKNETEINIDFDVDDVDTGYQPSTYPPTEKDYAPGDTVKPKKKKSITIKVQGGKNVEVDLGDNTPSNIHITHAGNTETVDSTHKGSVVKKNTTDSDSTSVKKEASGSSTSKRVIRLLPGLCISAVLGFIVWFIIRRRRQG